MYIYIQFLVFLSRFGFDTRPFKAIALKKNLTFSGGTMFGKTSCVQKLFVVYKTVLYLRNKHLFYIAWPSIIHALYYKCNCNM